MRDTGRPASFTVEIRRNEARRTYYIELTLLPYGVRFIVKRDMIRDLWRKMTRMEAEGYRYEEVEIPGPSGVG